MNFFSIILIFLLVGWSEPNISVIANRLTIIPTITVHDAEFDILDLIALLEQKDAIDLHLKMVTCPLDHSSGTSTDEMPGNPGFQHVAVFAADADDELQIGAKHKAALPCPPHCGGEKKYLISLADFKLTYK